MRCAAWKFELYLQPTAERISVLRQFVFRLVQESGTEGASRAAVATHELLDNALAASPDHGVHVSVELTDRKGALCIRIATRNRASAEKMATLERIFEAIRAEPDAWEYYRRAMKVAAERSEGSGLGLARIRWEAGMQLSLKRVEEGVLILAESPAAEGGGA